MDVVSRIHNLSVSSHCGVCTKLLVEAGSLQTGSLLHVHLEQRPVANEVTYSRIQVPHLRSSSPMLNGSHLDRIGTWDLFQAKGGILAIIKFDGDKHPSHDSLNRFSSISNPKGGTE